MHRRPTEWLLLSSCTAAHVLRSAQHTLKRSNIAQQRSKSQLSFQMASCDGPAVIPYIQPSTAARRMHERNKRVAKREQHRHDVPDRSYTSPSFFFPSPAHWYLLELTPVTLSSFIPGEVGIGAGGDAIRKNASLPPSGLSRVSFA
jgi:hypothetical protein